MRNVGYNKTKKKNWYYSKSGNIYRLSSYSIKIESK